jgi:hypothetical protein
MPFWMRSRDSGKLSERLFVQEKHEQTTGALYVERVYIDQFVERRPGFAFSTDDELEVIQVRLRFLGLHH